MNITVPIISDRTDRELSVSSVPAKEGAKDDSTNQANVKGKEAWVTEKEKRREKKQRSQQWMMYEKVEREGKKQQTKLRVKEKERLEQVAKQARLAARQAEILRNEEAFPYGGRMVEDDLEWINLSTSILCASRIDSTNSKKLNPLVFL
ncbi:uncharacterized protein RAG0_10829 [Rhynchosporium agropyri]|uniref:Uncharacterized protein n=1 Tax=Rhynchosporium agropyri TaxID=914238 RepID=A0A1E1L1D3_9HELO|nr:uncharacterized protein RAG0_10829 [Rhynchosporium agropyri]